VLQNNASVIKATNLTMCKNV